MTKVRIHLLGAICLGFMIANAQAQAAGFGRLEDHLRAI